MFSLIITVLTLNLDDYLLIYSLIFFYSEITRLISAREKAQHKGQASIHHGGYE